MENVILQKAFLEACVRCHVLSIRDGKDLMTPLVHRTKIKEHIPTICTALGIDVDTDDVKHLVTSQGVLDEQVLLDITKTNRSILTVAMVSLTIRYHRSKILPRFTTVDFIRRNFKQIESQKHLRSDKPHWAFVDWYELVKTNIFIHVPIPSEQETI